MATDQTTSKSEPAAKAETKAAAPAAKAEAPAAKAEAPAAKAEAPAAKADAKSGGSDSPPANYSRGEGQKPVSAAYRENWNVIFGDKSPKKGAKKSTAKKKR